MYTNKPIIYKYNEKSENYYDINDNIVDVNSNNNMEKLFTNGEVEIMGMTFFIDDNKNIRVDFKLPGGITAQDMLLHEIISKVGLNKTFYDLYHFLKPNILDKFIEKEIKDNNIELNMDLYYKE